MTSESGINRRDWLRLTGGALLALDPLLALAAPARPGEHMTLEGIPRFERHVFGNDGDAPVLHFAGWHPVKPEMLVLMRRGASQQLHRLDGPGRRPEPMTSGRDAVNSAAWEPTQGAYLVFSRDQGGNEAYRLYRLGADGGDPVTLTPAGERVSDYGFLPDGRGLVYLQERLDHRAPSESPIEDDDEREEREPREPRLGAEEQPASAAGPTAKGSPLCRIWWTDPLRPGERRLLAETSGRFTGLRISATGRILATSTRDGRSQFLEFSLNGDGARPVGSGAKSTLATSAPREDVIWRRQAVEGEFRHLVRTDVSSGRSRNELVRVESDLEAVAEPPAGVDRPLALVYNASGVSVLRLYRPGGTPSPIAQDLAPGVIRAATWHPTLPLLGFEQVSADSPGRLFAYSLESGQVEPWSAAASDAPRLQSDVMRWTSFDGLEITGLHIAPPARFTGPRPVYISLHGGPSSQARPGYLAGVMLALVEQLGMHVIMPNVRGSDGFGKTFLKLDNGRLRENAVRDVGALLDLIAKRPDMDATRVVVAGGSYGGYLSLAVATHESARLAGSICRVGIANFVSFLENTESYRRDNRRAEYGDERDPEMRAFLTSISPLTHADAVKKPLMVVHGRNDPRVPFGEAQAMVAAVRAQGTPVWFLSASDEGHSFTKADNRAYLNQATYEFVKRVVTGVTLQR
ncbi:hypothetical protein CDN99_11520 [Roseateles aquatilis]|uniref:Peptidase S9 prolyl oligopeptidase catalytic domain-containing protein n=1 Tax=Roseateles aquatilis TaxID=431061 RepID=A0A246JDZ5_9BURK|nr:prolyl oligopeptidase family serine peptidase [Roseateles aquatilis]OWQ90791.1 hypothetical protein CDN99_11520 [Roseateles aquatilis]